MLLHYREIVGKMNNYERATMSLDSFSIMLDFGSVSTVPHLDFAVSSWFWENTQVCLKSLLET